MSDEQQKTQENQGVPFDLTSCMAMIEEMMGQQGDGCGCTEIKSRMAGQGGCAEMMSQMMASCCGAQEETEEATTTETAPEA